jgi:purine-binding chemotaxis protein CheW
MSNGDQRYCTFLIDDLLFGIEVSKVQEVIRFQSMTRVPLAPRAIHGLINLRGQIVTAMDLRSQLDLPPLPEGRLPMNVVVSIDDDAVSFLVDEIGDVIEIGEDRFEKPPPTLSGRLRELVAGVLKLDRKLLLILDVESAASTERVQAAS